jgi:hypothetical protein
MKYFLRTAALAKALFFISALFFAIALIILLYGSVLDQVFTFSNGNYVSAAVFFAIFFVMSLVSLALAIVLKVIVRDATEELESMRGNESSK